MRERVRNEPPLISAVNPSARSLNGKILHREYRPIRSRKLGLVVLRIPKNLDLSLLTIANTIPLRTTNRKKSIRKNRSAPLRVVSPLSATKYLKNIG